VFTVGPNPVSRGGGVAQFFYSGEPVLSGDLTVYGASGNVVRRLRIGGGVSGAAWSWDLRDGDGRLVSEVAYLVRGTVRAACGKSGKVSSILGVR
jgi:hypothetical protein